MKRNAFALVATLVLGACATTPIQTPPDGSKTSTGAPITLAISTGEVARIDALLIQTRDLLLLAPDVARIKWNAKSMAVENRKAEAALVDNAAREATRLRADPGLFRDFFLAQIEASKFVQTGLFKQWRATNTPAMTLTRSVAQVQSASDTITPALMQALADVAPVLKIPGARAVVEARAQEIMPTRSSLSDPTRAIAIRPLLERAAP